MTQLVDLLGGLGFALIVGGGWLLAAGSLSAAGLGRRLRTSSYSDISRAAPSLVIFWVFARLRRPSAIACLTGTAPLLIDALAGSDA